MESKEEQELAVDIDQELNEVPSVLLWKLLKLKWSSKHDINTTSNRVLHPLTVIDFSIIKASFYSTSWHFSLRNVSIKWGAAIQVKISRSFGNNIFPSLISFTVLPIPHRITYRMQLCAIMMTHDSIRLIAALCIGDRWAMLQNRTEQNRGKRAE